MSPLRPIVLLVLALLAAGSAAFGQAADDKQATFFMGRVKYSANDGNDWGGVGQELMQLVSRASTIKEQSSLRAGKMSPGKAKIKQF